MNKVVRELGTDILLCVAIVACLGWAARTAGIYQPAHKLRTAIGKAWNKDGLTIAVVWPKHREPSFVEGAQFALDENNAAKNALSGKVRLKLFEEDEGVDGAAIAGKVASNRDVIAVLGHEYSEDVIGASMVYENHGILFIAPEATSPRLTTHGFKFVFRLTPDDRASAAALAKVCKRESFLKVAVLYARTPLGESLGPSLVSELAKEKIELEFYRSYLPLAEGDQHDFRPLIANLLQRPFDAVIVVDEMPRAAALITDLRKMGVKQPILGGDDLDSPELVDIAGQAAEGVYALSASDTSTQTPANLAFREAFRKRFKALPGYSASQGYESVKLLLRAILESKSADPLMLATTLRVGKWNGIFGDFTFTQQGEIVGRKLATKTMNHGVLAAIPGKEVACCLR